MKLEEKKILTFLCALWPGGGYMYLGMLKKGALCMALFTAMAGLALTVGWKFLAFLLPVIWCYCFFDTFHVARLSEVQRAEADRECFEQVIAFCKDDPFKKLEGKRTFLGVLILLAALYTMIYGVLLPFFRWGEQFYWVQLTLTVIPTAVVAVLLFMVGRHILQKEQDRKERVAAEEAAEAEIEEEPVSESTPEEGDAEEIAEAVLAAEEIAEAKAEEA